MTDKDKKVLVVSSFNTSSWDRYSKEFLDTLLDNWKDVDVAIYYDGASNDMLTPYKDRLDYVFNLDENENLQFFKKNNKERNGKEDNGAYNYRQDALKFSNKAFAIMDAYLEKDFKKKYEWIVWIDADTVTKKEFPKEELLKILGNCDVAHLGRTAIDYSETGFVGLNLQSVKTWDLIIDFEACYLSNEIFGYREWTDAFVFTRLINLHSLHGLILNNLSFGCEDLDAFEASPLIEYLYHKKGNRKDDPKIDSIKIPKALGRYSALVGLIKEYKSKNILEVGTWNGDRAIQMAITALKESNKVHYTGFDLFEEATDATDQEEFNVKKHFSEKDVNEKLTAFANSVNEADDEKQFTFCLIKGNTRQTLKIVSNTDACNSKNIKPDFAFIDGGHSLKTIEHDYNKLAHVPIVVFDDYYRPDEEGKIPDIKKVGCNILFEELDVKDSKKFLISSDDHVADGGCVGFGVIIHDPKIDLPTFSSVQAKTPIKVLPKDCMPNEYIQNNIEINTPKFTKWLDKKGSVNNETVFVVSAGPSLEKNIAKLKAEKRKHPRAKILCVKHALPILIENGIFPWGCIVLDPRPVDGVSTHGIVRKDLFKKIPKRTNFFIASMSDPTIVDLLIEKSSNTYGWHAYSNAIDDYEPLKNKMLITGGTCAAMRTLGLMYTLGFRSFKLFGFDCSLEGEPEDQKDAQLFQVGIGDEKKGGLHWTTGELLAMAQDFEQMINRPDIDMNIEVYGGGLVQSIWEDGKDKFMRLSYKEILDG